MRVATRSRNARSWVITTAVQRARCSTLSSCAMPSMSRWLVGSSSSSRSGCSENASASAARLRSPPEALSGAVSPDSPKRCRNSVRRCSVCHGSTLARLGSAARVSAARSSRLWRKVAAAGSCGSWSTLITRRPSRRLRSPSSRAIRPLSTPSSEDLPVPLRPIRPTRSPSCSTRLARSSSGSMPKASCASCSTRAVMLSDLLSWRCSRKMRGRSILQPAASPG